MPLDKQTVTVSLGGKLDESIDEKLLGRAGGSVARAENVQYDKHGLVSKCNGNTDVTYTVRSHGRVSDIDSVHYLGEDNGRLTLGGLAELSSESYFSEYYQAFSYHETDNEFKSMGEWPPVSQDAYRISHGSDDVEDPDGTVWGGYRWLTWVENGELWLTVSEESTGTIMAHGTLNSPVGAYTQPKFVPVDTRLHLFVRDGQNIRWFKLNPNTPEAPVEATVVIPAVLLLAARPFWDVCRINTGGNEYSALVYNDNVTGFLEVRYYVDTWDGIVAPAFTWNSGLDCDEAVTISQVTDYNAAEDHLLMAYVSVTVANSFRYITRLASNPGTARTNDTQIAALGAPTYEEVLQVTASSEYCSAWEDGDGMQTARIWAGMNGTAGGALGRRRVRTWRVDLFSGGAGAGGIYQSEDFSWFNHELMSKAWMHEGRSHVWMTHYSPDAGEESQMGAVLGVPSFRYAVTNKCRQQFVAGIHKDKLDGRTNVGLPGVTVDTNGDYHWACGVDEGSNQSAAVLNTVSFRAAGFTGAASDANVLHAGGTLYCNDGAMQPHGFMYYPQPQRTVGWANVLNHLATGGSLYDDVDYTYVYTYEWVDKNGQWHVSEPSTGTETVNPGGGASSASVVMNITTHIPGQWQREWEYCKICIYRNTTTGSAVAALEPYHLVGTVANDPSVTAVAFTDTMSDNTARTQPMLYTTGGVIENTTIPPTRFVSKHKNRTWIISDEDPRDIWYSKEEVSGVAAEFSALLKVRVNEPAVALASTPEAMMVLCENTIYAVYGEGPGDTGLGSFYTPRLMSRGVGCSSARSVAETEIGPAFQAGDSHIYILGDNLSPVKISDQVKDQLSSLHNVYRTIQEKDKKRIKFVINDGVAGHGNILLYDYEHSRWSEWVDRAGQSDQLEDACIYGNTFYSITDSYVLLKDDTGYDVHWNVGTDQGVNMAIESPWVDLGALTGLMRTWWINVLGEWVSTHSLEVYIYHDYNDSVAVQTVTFDCSTSKSPYVLRIKPEHQKSKVVKVLIREVPNAAAARSVDLTAVEFVCGFKHPKSAGYSLSG